MDQSLVVLKKLYLNEHASDEYRHAMGLFCKPTSPVHPIVRKIAGGGLVVA